MAKSEIELPEIGEGVTEGELVSWLVAKGDTVEEDQPLAEVMTDKATVEIPSAIKGIVLELKAKEGDVIEVGTVIAVLDTEVASSSKSNSEEKSKKEETPSSTASTQVQKTSGNGSHSAPSPVAASSSGDLYPPVAESRVLATPSTRRLAREVGVDINQIDGSGLAGRVTREDVLNRQPAAGATVAGQPSYVSRMEIPKPGYKGWAEEEERVPLKGIRRKIAEKMQMAKHVIPHFTLMDEANVTELVNMRQALKAKYEPQGVKVTYLPFVMKALLVTMREYPMFNASIDDAAQEIVYKKYFNIGFAADTPQGLLVPVIKAADQKSLLQLSHEILDLSKKARDGKLSLDEMKGANISVTNIGSVGGAYATPIINHPEVAILGMYKISKKPIFVGDEIKAAQIMNVSITADHRLIDGAVAANFLKAFIERLENPGVLMMEMM